MPISTGYHLAIDEGDAYDFLSTLTLMKADGTATNDALAVIGQRLPAGFSPPPHIHHNEDEAFYLLSDRSWPKWVTSKSRSCRFLPLAAP